MALLRAKTTSIPLQKDCRLEIKIVQDVKGRVQIVIFIDEIKFYRYMNNKVITEEYVNSLTESELLNEQANWTAAQWQQYLCPNGTISLEEFRQELYNKVDEMILKKYGSNYIS